MNKIWLSRNKGKNGTGVLGFWMIYPNVYYYITQSEEMIKKVNKDDKNEVYYIPKEAHNNKLYTLDHEVLICILDVSFEFIFPHLKLKPGECKEIVRTSSGFQFLKQLANSPPNKKLSRMELLDITS